MMRIIILIKHTILRFLWKIIVFYVMRIKKTSHPVSGVQIVNLKFDYKLYIIPALWDNYSYMIEKNKKGLMVDPSDFLTIDRILKKYSIDLKFILVTHDHIDHIADVTELSRVHKAEIFALCKSEIPGEFTGLNDESIISFCDIHLKILHCPGHTKNNCVWYSEELGIVFTGDTLFFCGYGGILDNPKNMFYSLQKIKKLPETTNLFFGHEYGIFNVKFTVGLEPDNQLLLTQYAVVKDNLQKKLPSVPSSLAIQKKINLFLRYDEYEEFENVRKMKKKYNEEN